MARYNQVGKVGTYVIGDGDNLVVSYHGTPVVTVANGQVTLRNGGWFTATTKTRMNQAANQYGLGFGVYQKKGVWYIALHNGETLEFRDGITFPIPG